MHYLEEIDYRSPQFGNFYDELPLWSAPFGLLLLEHVVMRPDMTILDVGAGTGFLTIELAQRCGSNAKVIAVDPWEAAMLRLREKSAFLELQNIQTLIQDVATVDLPAQSVDLIVSNLGLNNFTDPAAALRTCFHVAKPGANLFLTTNLVGHMAEFYDVYRDTLIELGCNSRLQVLDAHVNQRATLEKVTSMLVDAGFEFVEAQTHTFHERFADGSALLRHYFMRLGFVPGWKSIAPADSVNETFTALERRLNAIAADRGELSLTVPAACIQARKPVE